ncbi:DUF2782 domain-containing protein [Luteimonas sp. MHLX1A]|uniref:DUF2782 domain-containing protein n=1 Tax=Alterluteimonas muca TaxID=2878684 RepID=UPI001E596B80|nr:DUF2782 domain-containing protein [Luteimonas sp. MHLX1A]MCD9047964.1 DUF2782 domain-containing protein [Luteimonas sp. MHLX1A]
MNIRSTAGLSSLSLLLALGLAACASTPGTSGPEGLPADAMETTRTEANGDVITEYRIAGQLRAVRVQPSRGPVYYLYDRDGDGSIDNREGDNPPVTYFRLFEWE